MDLESIIRDNIAGRRAAELLIAMAKEEADKLAPKARLRFWECIKEVADEVLPEKKLEPMSDKECRAFGDEQMQFGKYEGKYVDDVPLPYLEWMADSEAKHARKLSRYLQSRRIRQEDP